MKAEMQKPTIALSKSTRRSENDGGQEREENRKIEIASLTGEIWAEIHHMCLHGDIPGFDLVTCEEMRELMEKSGKLVNGPLIALITSVLARHCGEEIANCEGGEFTPLPFRDFGEDDDDN